MLIGLIRHGLTDWNAAGRIQGRSDIPLNEEGRRQAHRLAKRLKGEPYRWDFAISSGLLRARETAQIIASALDIPLLEADERLAERGFGQVEGMTQAEREERFGTDWNSLDIGQEKLEALEERALAFMDDIETKHPDRNVLVISHGGLLAQLYLALYEGRYTERIGNLALTVLEKEGELWEPLLYNCTKHLLEEPSGDRRTL
ncbi:histidine phosphatase family protein [Saccharibacillus sp. CPCC 101409]|uniref:histidine phosphatase family protein n=1 Tax=Saccharibacillus sp. CPCC 101409 TaxID=3058041 RepID=UPI002671C216|nr:histidine phosphatase family protein [Saccharibacillus sp. CPCC 101409]MDO3409630.1 histidine phosphatase family protein [Saccharibacillus sp. CPCC 101409]